MKKALYVTTVAVIFLTVFSIFDYTRFNDRKLHIVFCDVGQGDGIFIRTPSGKNILIDGGPDKSILSCLAAHMPFWDRTIHLMFLSHPHDDHFSGLYYVIEKYTVLSFDTERLSNKSDHFQAFVQEIRSKDIPTQYLIAGDTFSLGDGVRIEVLGPTKEYLSETSPEGDISDRAEFASLITKLAYGNFSIVFTGDSLAQGINRVLRKSNKNTISVLQVPHHGSKTGLDKNVIRLLSPKLAVISVGKNNYGHPSTPLITLLEQSGTKVLRTDKEGDIEIVIDGKEWEVKN